MNKTKNIERSNVNCRCQQQLSTIDSDKKQTEWYKEMYGQIHKSPEKKKDVILVKIPPTSSRYRKDYQRDDQQNPYKPTYTFPEEFDGNLERMENYIRKAASEDIEDDDEDEKKIEHSENVSTVKDHRTIHFDDRLSSPTSLASTEQTKSNNNHTTTTTTSSSITINPRSNTTPTRTSDDEKKSIYKRILRGGEIPSTGLQKLSINNRVSSSSRQRPLILTNNPPLLPNIFAYYSLFWEQNQSNNLINNDMRFEINSCLYFQNNTTTTTNHNDDDDEWEQVREDGCGYIIIYPPHIHPTENLQIYNFNRTKNLLLRSTDIHLNSKTLVALINH